MTSPSNRKRADRFSAKNGRRIWKIRSETRWVGLYKGFAAAGLFAVLNRGREEELSRRVGSKVIEVLLGKHRSLEMRNSW